MQPGIMNRRICIQNNLVGKDAAGQATNTWNTVYSCWAALNVQGGKQVYSTAEFTTKTAYNIEVRWTPSFLFQPNQRVIYVEQSSGVTHTYTIESISNPNQSNKTVMILAYELEANE